MELGNHVFSLKRLQMRSPGPLVQLIALPVKSQYAPFQGELQQIKRVRVMSKTVPGHSFSAHDKLVGPQSQQKQQNNSYYLKWLPGKNHLFMHAVMHTPSRYACCYAEMHLHIAIYACYHEGSATTITTTILPFDSGGWKNEIPTLPCCVLRAGS